MGELSRQMNKLPQVQYEIITFSVSIKFAIS